MKFIHEFDSHGWKTYHRLVWLNPLGERIEGGWALYEAPAFLSVEEMGGKREPELTPPVGYFALTDYYTSGGSMVAAYSALKSVANYVTDVTVHELTKEEHLAEQAADGEADEGEAGDNEFVLKA